MTEPDPSAAPVPAPFRFPWRRSRLYGWTLLLAGAIVFFGAVYMIRCQPKRVAVRALRELPIYTSVDEVKWLDPYTLEFNTVKVGDFFYADSITITATLGGLFRHHIENVKIRGGQLFTGPLDNAMTKMGPGSGGLDWTLGQLEIERGTVLLDNVGLGTTSVPVRLGVRRPILLKDIRLNNPDSGIESTKERMVDIENVNLVSPFDPLAPVLSFPLSRIRFTYAELWHHHIREVDLVRPTLHLGQDLFWLTDEFKKTRESIPPTGVHAPWEVAHFEVQYGQLAVNAFGQPAVILPFFFETKVDDIRLDQLDKITAKSTIAIKRLDQDYPDYKIRIVNLSGRLDFSLPITDAHANNVVNTISIEELSWNEIPMTKVWSSVTFDPEGVYGQLGGECETGYVKGNFEIYYTDGFKWNGDLFAQKVNCQPIAAKLVGKYLSLTGLLDGEVDVKGRATEILSCKGELVLPHAGMLTLQSLDDLMKRLPDNISVLKRDLARLSLNAFEFYPYNKGELKIDYQPNDGVATLRLDSPNGQRKFDIYWHPYVERETGSGQRGTSKVAKDTDNQ